MNTLLILLSLSAEWADPPAGAPTAFVVDEHAETGTVVGQISSSRLNGRPTLQYRIVSGNESGALAVDAATGRLTVGNTRALDFETHPFLELAVEIADPTVRADALRNSFLNRLRESGVQTGDLEDSSGRETARVTVQLRNVNEHPTLAPQTFILPENTPAGTCVGTISATDPDAGDVVRYAIIGGDSAALFRIGKITGLLTVADQAALDFETCRRHRLTVQVTDNGGLQNAADIFVELTDVNEAPQIQAAAFRVNVDAPSGTVVGTVVARDPEEGGAVTFSFADGAATAFAIDSTTGQITVRSRQSLARLSQDRVDLPVRAVDAAGNSATVVVTLLLNRLDPRPAVTRRPNAPAKALTLTPAAPRTGASAPAARPADARDATPDASASQRLAESERVPVIGRRSIAQGALLLVSVVALALHAYGLFGWKSPKPPADDAPAAYLGETDRNEALTDRLAELQSCLEQLQEENRRLAEDGLRREQERTRLQQQLQAAEAERDRQREQCEALLAEIVRLEQAPPHVPKSEAACHQPDVPRYSELGDVLQAVDELSGMTTSQDSRPSPPPEGIQWDGPARGTPSSDPRVAELRATLAVAFGLPVGDGDHLSVSPASPAAEQVVECSTTTALAVVDVPEDADTDAAAAEIPDPVLDDASNPDSISAYMEALLKRTRQKKPAATTPAPKTPARQTSAVEPASSHAAATAAGAPAATAASPRPRPQFDKEALRINIDSLREVANLNTRSALSQYARRKCRRRLHLAGGLGMASLVAAGLLLTDHAPLPIPVPGAGWLALGVGSLLLAEFVRLWRFRSRFAARGKNGPEEEAAAEE